MAELERIAQRASDESAAAIERARHLMQRQVDIWLRGDEVFDGGQRGADMESEEAEPPAAADPRTAPVLHQKRGKLQQYTNIVTCRLVNELNSLNTVIQSVDVTTALMQSHPFQRLLLISGVSNCEPDTPEYYTELNALKQFIHNYKARMRRGDRPFAALFDIPEIAAQLDAENAQSARTAPMQNLLSPN